MLAIAVGCELSGKKSLQRFQLLLTVFGVIAVTVSATPLPYWYYGLMLADVIVWLIVCGRKTLSVRVRRVSVISVITVITIAAGLEIPFQFVPAIDANTGDPVVIYGDSLTAGIGEQEAETWPEILKRTTSLEIHDLSRMGATTATVLHKIREKPMPRGIAIVEIGGNDLLGNTSTVQFEDYLDEILRLLSEHHHAVIMFELPLPPFYNEFGRIQRKLAKKYSVALIPKRILTGVLAGDEATLDSIHLTQRGHDEMAEILLRILGLD